jgi:hypothetical protein
VIFGGTSGRWERDKRRWEGENMIEYIACTYENIIMKSI